MKAKRRQSKAAQPVLSAGTSLVPRDYRAFLDDLKGRIRAAQVRAALAVNRELIQLYWSIGRAIAHKQEQEGWGGKVIDRLARDIQSAFPGITGFSRANVYRMRAFYLAYRPATPVVAQPVRQLAGKRRPVKSADATTALERSETSIVAQSVRQSADEVVPQIVGQIPWGHNVILLERLADPTQRLWYAQQAIANGWSRTMLEHWIESDLYARQGQAVTNFQDTLPIPQSDLAQQLLKDPYNFDFLTLHAQAMERELEEGLLEHLTRFLLELGEGFAFVGRQVHLEVDGRDFYIDLLFYHLGLRCFVAIDLKTREFEPEFAGKMNFYLSAVDDRFRQEHDQPSIGLILCKKRSRVIAEYALRHLERPVGVARYVTRLTERLPKELAGRLPTVKEIEVELARPKDNRRKRDRREGGN